MLQRSRSLRSECHWTGTESPCLPAGFNEVAPFGASVTFSAFSGLRFCLASTKSLPSERVSRHAGHRDRVVRMASTKSLPSERVSPLLSGRCCDRLQLQRSRSLRSECHGIGQPTNFNRDLASTKSLPSERVSRGWSLKPSTTSLLQRSRSLRSECHQQNHQPPPYLARFNEVAPFGASVTR